MNLPCVFALVGIAFGVVFVLVNVGGLPGPWTVPAVAVGAVLAAAAAWRGVIRAAPASEPWTGSARAYWLAVAAEIVAIPVGATVLNRVTGTSDLGVLWVVFVVGAHFMPARAFGVGRYAELGAGLVLIAVVFGVLRLAGHVDSAPAAGGVVAGLCLLAFSAVPALSRSAGEARG